MADPVLAELRNRVDARKEAAVEEAAAADTFAFFVEMFARNMTERGIQHTWQIRGGKLICALDISGLER